jgi:hypothetical protein
MLKKMISIRLDRNLLVLLDKASKTPNTIYAGKSRTFLIEEAIKEQYKMFSEINAVEKHG